MCVIASGALPPLTTVVPPVSIETSTADATIDTPPTSGRGAAIDQARTGLRPFDVDDGVAVLEYTASSRRG